MACLGGKTDGQPTKGLLSIYNQRKQQEQQELRRKLKPVAPIKTVTIKGQRKGDFVVTEHFCILIVVLVIQNIYMLYILYTYIKCH